MSGHAALVPGSRMVRLLLLIVPLGIGANVAFTLATTDRAAWQAASGIAPAWLAVAAALTLAPWFWHSLRLLVWSRFLGVRLSFRGALHCVIGAELGTAVAPIAVGGPAAKTALLIGRGLSAAQAATITAVGALEDLVFFAVALPIGFLATGAWRLPVVVELAESLRGRLLAPGTLAAAAVLLLMLLAAWRVLRRRAPWREAAAVLRVIARGGKSRFALTVLLTACQWSCRYSVITAVVASLGIAADPVRLFVFQWVVFTVMTFVPTPGAALGAESAFYVVYGQLLPEPVVGLATAGWRFFTFYLLVIVAAVVFAIGRFSRRGRADEVPTTSLPPRGPMARREPSPAGP